MVDSTQRLENLLMNPRKKKPDPWQRYDIKFATDYFVFIGKEEQSFPIYLKCFQLEVSKNMDTEALSSSALYHQLPSRATLVEQSPNNRYSRAKFTNRLGFQIEREDIPASRLSPVSLVILASHFEATRGLIWEGPRNFEPRSDDEGDT
ncbi:hypothetical protein AVEN_89385-1 [Araneus ventricosus]|uniref:Uncharacterized protein n=1 Tax=Araneus ventricosus TaxID=182803 RepID=A0A4Y2QEQ9_ARAVE|nr:hypothetical protein AVEN_89385-1 [Araneus ventricosus]